MDPEVQDIISLLRRSFEKDAWHGPSVREVLETVLEKQAFSRLPNTHSIIELVAHMTSWRTYVMKKLNGDGLFKISDEQNFPKANDWRLCLEQLEESQKLLIESLQNITAGKLKQPVPGCEKPLTFYDLLHGIIHHDLYHAGQIVLIQKATAQSF